MPKYRVQIERTQTFYVVISAPDLAAARNASVKLVVDNLEADYSDEEVTSIVETGP